jgi:predicted nucleic acid-binding protein
MEKVYIETTIPSYVVSRLSRDITVLSHQKITEEWWEVKRYDYDLFISQIVIDEITAGDSRLAAKRNELIADLPMLEYNSDIEKLAHRYHAYLGLPEKSFRDAFHIAFATYYEMDYLLTWNCRHLANAAIRSKLTGYNFKLGYRTPDLCTPEELR